MKHVVRLECGHTKVAEFANQPAHAREAVLCDECHTLSTVLDSTPIEISATLLNAARAAAAFLAQWDESPLCRTLTNLRNELAGLENTGYTLGSATGTWPNGVPGVAGVAGTWPNGVPGVPGSGPGYGLGSRYAPGVPVTFPSGAPGPFPGSGPSDFPGGRHPGTGPENPYVPGAAPAPGAWLGDTPIVDRAVSAPVTTPSKHRANQPRPTATPNSAPIATPLLDPITRNPMVDPLYHNPMVDPLASTTGTPNPNVIPTVDFNRGVGSAINQDAQYKNEGLRKGGNINMTLTPTEQNRLVALQQKPVAQQTEAEKQELAALVQKQNQ